VARQEKKPQQFEFPGEVLAICGNNNYRVRVDIGKDRNAEVLCYLSGNMRRFKISVLVGDTVKVILPPPFDKGRITFREK
jgi:translation initiation factor IF-1